MMFLENLAEAILRICQEKRISHETAAERCHLSVRYFGSIVRRKTCPSLRTLEKLCIGLGSTPNALLLGALQRDTPRSVESTIHLNDESYPVCPACGAALERESQCYCDRCGQHLDWAAFEKAMRILQPK